MDENQDREMRKGKPKLPMLGSIAQAMVTAHVSTFVSMSFLLVIYSFFKSPFFVESLMMKVRIFYSDDGSVTIVSENPLISLLDNLFLISCVAFFVTGIAYRFFTIADTIENGRRIWTRVLLKVFIGVLAFFVFVTGMINIPVYSGYLSDYVNGAEYYSISHEDRQIVVREWSFFFAGGAEIHQRMEDGSLVQIGYICTDDGERHHGNYGVIWQEDGVTLEYHINWTIQKEYCQWVD